MLPRTFKILPGFAIWLLLLVGYILYLPGQRGIFQFDDQVNLQGLANVHDGWSALVFIAGGEAGALSRPIALASFLLNWGDWPNHPQGFLFINILIHLLNGALLAWFVLRLIRLIQPDSTQRMEWIAVITAALWLLAPLLASTTLIIIQRMASLCATFVLIGLLIYLIGLSWEASGRTLRGRWLQATGIGLGILLAVLTKENGILLPLYAFILEVTVLTSVRELHVWRRWRMCLLATPIVLLLIYFAFIWSGITATYTLRNFTLGERLLTESVILWDYLRSALLPQMNAFSPFHDDYPVVRSLFAQPLALIALLGWLTIIVVAFWRRRRWPWFALAVFWYLGGHLLESTVLPLELYFEHRNYLPLIGPVLALSWLIWTLQPASQKRRFALAALMGYILLLAGMLWQITTLWGQPLIAGEVWTRQHPTSIRATNFLAGVYLMIGDPTKARQGMEQAAYANPASIERTLNTLVLICQYETMGRNEIAKKTRELYRMALDHAVTSEYSSAVPEALLRLQNLGNQGKCNDFERTDLYRIATLLMSNPHYTTSGRRLSYLHHFLAGLYRDEKDLDGTLKHLEAAWAAEPEIGTATLIVGTMLSAGLRDEARAFLDQAQKQLPLNPVLRIEWLKIIGQLWEAVDGRQASAPP